MNINLRITFLRINISLIELPISLPLFHHRNKWTLEEANFHIGDFMNIKITLTKWIKLVVNCRESEARILLG